MDFLNLRREIIKKYFGTMNDRQFEAVTTVNGPLLVLAGAGSGKTTVLVNRILNLVKFGDGYNSNFIPDYWDEDIKAGESFLKGESDYLPEKIFSVNSVNPWQILAITFTNKAAGELKERIAAKLGEGANDIWAGTFHSVCGKILRRYGDLLGYTSHFTIYDTDDQRRLMKEIMKAHNIDDKMLPHKSVLNAISNAKDQLISPEEFEASAGIDHRLKTIGKLYKIYQNRLKNADAMDFDDMIVKTVKLLNEALDKLPDTQLILNGDDPLSAHFGKGKKCIYYGVDDNCNVSVRETKEGRFCSNCGAELSYNYYHYSQLGDYFCPSCSFKRPNLDYAARNVSLTGGMSFDVCYKENKLPLRLNYRGFYNIYNVLA